MIRKRIHQRLFNTFLSDTVKERGERLVIVTAILSFFIHLCLIILTDLEIISIHGESHLLHDPIAAIYTPFSFILIYEVYLLVYHIPKSTSYYIGKQYEIITLIVIRALFKDLSMLDFSVDWFQDPADLQFTYDLITTLILFLLIYFFHRLNEKPERTPEEQTNSDEVFKLIKRKEYIAICLVPIFLGIALYTLSEWAIEMINSGGSHMTDLNNIFFDEFFTILILADVLLLLFSLFQSDRFSNVIRNSGFIVSTILLRLSFSSEGILRNILVITAVLFGVIILLIFNQYRRLKNL